jgi:hypothetical protein
LRSKRSPRRSHQRQPSCDPHGGFSTIEGPSPSVDGYRAAHPVVVAALLGADAGRGAEIIADWEMDDRAW